ncbi:MAG: hypothetical protein AAFY47_03630 [Pseudomonadota bacterium]
MWQTLPNRQMPAEFRGRLLEAVCRLGYFKIGEFERLLDHYIRAWPEGVSGSLIRTDDILPLLTEKGSKAPYHAQKVTFARAFMNLRRQEWEGKQELLATFSSQVQFAARGEHVCDMAEEIDGQVVERSRRIRIPLENCGAEYCGCRWDDLPD